MVRPHPEPAKLEHPDMMPIRIFKVSQMTPAEPGLKNPALNKSPPMSLAMLYLFTAHQPVGLFPSSRCSKFVCAFGTWHQVFFLPGRFLLRPSPSRVLPVIYSQPKY